MEVKQIAIIGAGAMGSGIAQVSAVSGYTVFLTDVSTVQLEKAKRQIAGGFNKLVQKGKLTADDAAASLARIRTSDALGDSVRQADLVIEAVFENLDLKQGIFKELEKLCSPEAILASNTSALPITEIASVTKSAGRVIGIHFMNPVPLMKGVEIIRGQLTSEGTLETATHYVKSIGKEPIVAIDYAGFIVSRLVDVLMNEAVKMVEEGNRPEEIDRAMELCAGHPMGPCKLLDLVGAEIAMHGMETMARDLGERYKPHPLLRKRVLAGLLGKKTGQGFYRYE